jgi:vacuolar-type H+-ATPase subunit E/Vma4
MEPVKGQNKAEAEQIYAAAVDEAKRIRDEAIEGAWNAYLEVLAVAERSRQETVGRAWNEYMAAEVRANDQCQEVLTQAYKIYQETVPEDQSGPDVKGGQ